MAGKFEVYKDKGGKFRFRLKAGNGQVILTGEGYNSKSSCLEGIESVKKNSKKDSAFEIYQDKKGEYRFKLKAANGETIGQGEGYSTRSGCMRGIASIAKNAVSARIVEI